LKSKTREKYRYYFKEWRNEKMEVDLDHPTISHLLGYLTEEKWADAIRGKHVNIDMTWELLRIQDDRYHGNMTEAVKEIVGMTDKEYNEYRKSLQK
jgi:hypothetical protein